MADFSWWWVYWWVGERIEIDHIFPSLPDGSHAGLCRHRHREHQVIGSSAQRTAKSLGEDQSTLGQLALTLPRKMDGWIITANGQASIACWGQQQPYDKMARLQTTKRILYYHFMRQSYSLLKKLRRFVWAGKKMSPLLLSHHWRRQKLNNYLVFIL